MFGYPLFFFKQKTAYEMRISDWSSDVCSSDLAYLSNNNVASGQIAEVIHTVHGALKGLTGDGAAPEPEPLRPAVPIRKSVAPDYIVCLEDGKQLSMLKSHLRTT